MYGFRGLGQQGMMLPISELTAVLVEVLVMVLVNESPTNSSRSRRLFFGFG